MKVGAYLLLKKDKKCPPFPRCNPTSFINPAIPALFESEEYRARTEAIQEAFNKRRDQEVKDVGDEAEKQEIVLLRTPDGFAFAPTRNHEVIPPNEYEKLPDEEKRRVEAAIAVLQERLEKVLRQMPQWRRERQEQVKQLDRETILSVRPPGKRVESDLR